MVLNKKTAPPPPCWWGLPPISKGTKRRSEQNNVFHPRWRSPALLPFLCPILYKQTRKLTNTFRDSHSQSTLKILYKQTRKLTNTFRDSHSQSTLNILYKQTSTNNNKQTNAFRLSGIVIVKVLKKYFTNNNKQTNRFRDSHREIHATNLTNPRSWAKFNKRTQWQE